MKRVVRIVFGVCLAFVVGIVVLYTIGVQAETKQLNALADQQQYSKLIESIRGKRYVSRRLIRWVRKNAEEGHVPLQLELSRLLLKVDPRESARWLAIGHLGATLDASLCEDPTSGAAPAALLQAYRQVAVAVAEDPQRVIEATEQSFLWHDQHPVRPSPRWICYHGLRALKGQVALKPTDQWKTAQVEARQAVLSSWQHSKEALLQRMAEQAHSHAKQ